MKFFALLAAATLWIGCGPTPCQRASDSLKKFETKAGKCASGAKVRTLNLTTCEDNLASCSPDDAKKLETYWKCLEAVSECDPAKPADFKTAADACEQGATQFQQSCGAGIGT